MAREVTEKLIDDLDGGDAVETVTFGLDGAAFEIDLGKKNAAALRKALEPYVKAGRRSSAARRKSAPATTAKRAQRDYDIVALREWAGANNLTVPSRGRIPQAVVEQYKAAGGRQASPRPEAHHLGLNCSGSCANDTYLRRSRPNPPPLEPAPQASTWFCGRFVHR